MEGDKAKSLAYRQYQRSKNRARYVGEAQKLAQHLNNLAEDPNARYRWVWQLIQNAKDVPNQFSKVKIRIQIRDDKLIFAHNGDPFRVSDLQSLFAQYSSKAEENKVNLQTTGKYGTGFITTYLLSRKVRIKGLLQMKPESEEKKKSSQKQAKKGLDESQLDRFQINEEDIHNSSSNKDVKAQNGLYQRFDIFLDRTYKDRDTDFVEKLMETEQTIEQHLKSTQAKPKWQRNQDEFNTQFMYEDLDQYSHKIIWQAISYLKQLFPYALLFNPKLSELHVVNKSCNKKIKSFTIKRIDEVEKYGLKIFNAKVTEEGKQSYNFSAAYMEDEDTYSQIAVPVSLEKQCINMLETNDNIPKIFKEFPLIGCKDHGFNFVFTSRRFYPNQTRSDLLLNQIEGRFSPKAKANWDSLEAIFSKGLQLYKTLADVISEGQENLLKVILQNQFTCTTSKSSDKSEDNLIFQTLIKYQEELGKMKFIEFKDGKRRSLNDLAFPKGSSQLKNAEDKDYSIQLNEVFSQIIGQNKTLATKHYKKFYSKLNKFYDTWKHSTCKYWNVKDCILELSKNTIQGLEIKIGDKDKVLDVLDQIYAFLEKYNPFYMTQRISQSQMENFQNHNLSFVLTNKEEFKSLHSRIRGHPLMIKEELPKAYEEIAEQIGIDIDDYTINDQFVDYFKKIKTFKIQTMLDLYKQVLFVPFKISFDNKTNKQNQNQIVLLGRFLTTFGIKSNCIELIQKLKNFDLVSTPFKLSEKQSHLALKQNVKKEYRYLFNLKVIKYINDMFNQNSNLDELMSVSTFVEKEDMFSWLNRIFEEEKQLVTDEKVNEYKEVYPLCITKFEQYITLNKKLQLIDNNISISEKFISRSLLQCFSFKKDGKLFKGRYPTDLDIKFYENMRQAENSQIRQYNRARIFAHQRVENTWILRDRILHEKINDRCISGTTYEKVFDIAIRVYYNNDVSVNHKLKVLDQIYRLRRVAIKDEEQEYKINHFKAIEDEAYFMYPKYKNETLVKPEHKRYAFHLLKNKEEIDNALELEKKYGSLAQALKKMEEMEEAIKQHESK